ncbi:MAG: hypothetical protein VR69_11790 [Peptococcaceae bacterium BRH_c4b]|nr:MAG: hypothetical protein VR69_11790 [Peptococcaceae bacterium BRH_c4b]
MPSTWLGIETSRRGMMVHQRALDTTGHNLANASTTGYSRQEVVITPTDPYSNPTLNSSVTPGQIGTGTKVQMIRRVTDEYLQNNVLKTANDSSYWENQVSVLQQAETTFAEPETDGIDADLVDFFTSWMDLENSPQDSGVKGVVVEAGDGLAKLMGTTYNQLESIQNNVAKMDAAGTGVDSGALKDKVDKANDILEQIRDLTVAIKKIYMLNQQPNDLLDQRDQLLEQLSEIGPIEVKYSMDANGQPTGDFDTLNFFGCDVKTVLSGDSLNLSVDSSNDHIHLNITDSTGAVTDKDLTADCATNTSGSLLGLEESRQLIIDYKNKLDELATELSAQIKAVDPVQGAPDDFFTGTLAGHDFGVATNLLDDPSILDGTKAGDVAALRDADISFTGVSNQCTFEEYYSTITSEAGADAKKTNDMYSTLSAIRTQVANLKESVSGVSTDEELTKMLQYQYGFQASARVVNTIDGMLDVIINKLF